MLGRVRFPDQFVCQAGGLTYSATPTAEMMFSLRIFLGVMILGGSSALSSSWANKWLFQGITHKTHKFPKTPTTSVSSGWEPQVHHLSNATPQKWPFYTPIVARMLQIQWNMSKLRKKAKGHYFTHVHPPILFTEQTASQKHINSRTCSRCCIPGFTSVCCVCVCACSWYLNCETRTSRSGQF